MTRKDFRRVLGSSLTLILLLAGCGGGSGSPTSTPTPAPLPTAAPQPTPTPEPSPTPIPCTQGLCEQATVNTAPVTRVILKLYQVFDQQGQWVMPTPIAYWDVVTQPIPVGYSIRLDVTGKDGNNKDTLGEEDITFHYSDDDMIAEQFQSSWQRKLKVRAPGKFSAYVVFDGVRSNELQFTFAR